MSKQHYKIRSGLLVKGVSVDPSDAEEGDLIFRSDTHKYRIFRNSNWADFQDSRLIQVLSTTDTSTTGSNATIALTPTPFIRLTNASLISLDGIASSDDGVVITLTNATGNSIEIFDETGATVANRIKTGTGNPLIFNNDSSVSLMYDGTSARWRIVGATDKSGYIALLKLNTIYSAIVGTSAQVLSGAATHSSLQTAINDVATTGDILVLSGVDITEDIVLNKELSIEGQGHGSSIEGNLLLQSGSNYSNIDKMRFSGQIEFDVGTVGNSITNCWQGESYDELNPNIDVSAGAQDSFALKSNGTVWGVGFNNDGELGDNTNISKSSSVQVVLTGNYTQVASGYDFSLALKSNGTISAWGIGTAGQLGNNSTGNYSSPVQVSGANSYTQVATGSGHAIALNSDGGVWTWGQNADGQLGDNTTTSKSSPILIAGGPQIYTQISHGASHSIALKSDGTVWTWGNNDYGQLGNNNTVDQYTPVQVVNLSSCTAVDAGGSHSLALKSDGTVWAWGHNAQGQLGNNTVVDNSTPVQVLGSSFTQIAAGGFHSVAIKTGGTVWTWGYNGDGELGVNTITNHSTPVQVTLLSGSYTQVAAGTSHSLALRSDRFVWAWGYNGFGQLGDNTTTNRSTPAQIIGDSYIQIAGGGSHSLAIKSDFTTWTWGDNANGQLGLNTIASHSTPMQITSLSGSSIVQVIAGDNYSLALQNNSSIWAWGYNSVGQLGNNSITSRSTPVAVSISPGSYTQIAAGGVPTGGHSAALKSDGTIWSWGLDTTGQLGNNSLTNKSTPVQVIVRSFTQVASGQAHSLAIDTLGKVWSWGRNTGGQLGINSLISRSTPVQVTLLTASYTQVSGGDEFSLALKSDGTVWSFGFNGSGQLGDTTIVSKSSPVQVTSLICAQIESGGSHSLALKSNGAVYAWGLNASGQLGINNTTNKSSPVQVSLLAGGSYTTISAGATQSIAVKSDGTAWGWGDNFYHQLGDVGSSVSSPVQVLGSSYIITDNGTDNIFVVIKE